MDRPTLALRRHDILAQSGAVPAACNLGCEVCGHGRMSGIVDQIARLGWVFGKVIEQRLVALTGDIFVSSAPDHEHRVPGHFRAVFTDGFVDRVCLTPSQRHQRPAVDGHADYRLLGPCTARNIEHGRQDIDEATGIGR